jgi:small-conductance mechanosensitive channel
MSLLLNGYPPNFITKQFNRLLHSNHPISESKQMDEHVYHRMHQILLHQPTRREQQLNKMIKDPIESPLVLQPQIWNSKLMYPRYLFDSGLSTNLPHEFIKWWKEYYSYPGSSVYDVKVRLVAKTHRTLESFFIHKKPSREMLTKME